MRKTKIVATLGPASNDVEMIKKLIQNGMNAARINFSHGTYDSHREIIERLKEAREALQAPIPMMLDTKGPEIRIKTFKDNKKIYLEQNSTFILTTEDIEGDESRVSITYKQLPKDLKEGDRVLLDDALLELKVQKLTETDIVCQVVNSGFLSSRKGVNVPGVFVNLPSITEKDEKDIQFGIEMGFDFIAASFIRSANDILKIREVLAENGGDNIQIIAKIENQDGVDNLDSILEVADGIMVARGDLGVEIPAEEVPLVQKKLISRANEMGKPVITATQMLESMVNNPRPTRAEANDIANAIMDGSDCIMLSGETAQGRYPAESVETMARIARKTEESINYYDKMTGRHRMFRTNITNAIGFAACTTAADLNAACVVTITDSGFTARMVSHFRPPCPILAVTPNPVVGRQLNLSWGCFPTVSKSITGNDEVFEIAVSESERTGLAKAGDIIVVAAGVPVGEVSTTNTLRVQVVGSVLAKGRGISNKVVTGRANVIKVLEEAEKFFKEGDILITTQTTNEMLPFMKKAAAIVVGSWENIDNSHTETVALALDKPVIICDKKVIDLIPNYIPITVDCQQGYVFNGVRNPASCAPTPPQIN